MSPRAARRRRMITHEPRTVQACRGQASTSVEVVSVVRASKDSFQIRWVERKFHNNSPVFSTEHWTGLHAPDQDARG